MNSIPNPDSWMDVFTILAVTLIIALPSWLSMKANRAIKNVHDQVTVVRNQVVNGHATALREDMDGMKSDVKATIDSLRTLRDEVRGGFASVRADLNEERNIRRDGDLALRNEIRNRKREVGSERFARERGDKELRDDLDAYIEKNPGSSN